jgi:ATP/maltotriose-dependent transcriptional regulator MalT
LGKITHPILPEVYPRKRLFQLLDKLRRQPLIWISEPGGCDKTTLVASYLDERKFPCLWYQVDPGDQDPATFFHYLAQAAKRAFPKKKAALPAFTQDFAQALPAFSQWYFEKIFDLLPPSGNDPLIG